MERLQQLRIFWAYKWLLLLFALAAAATAYFLSSRQTDTYKAESLAQIVSSRQAAGELLSEDELLSLSNVYLRLADTDTVLRLAHDDPAVTGAVAASGRCGGTRRSSTRASRSSHRSGSGSSPSARRTRIRRPLPRGPTPMPRPLPCTWTSFRPSSANEP